MRIDGFDNKILFNYDNIYNFKKGEIIKGTILDVVDDLVFIDIGNNRVLKAQSNVPIFDDAIGTYVELVVNEVSGNRVLTSVKSECADKNHNEEVNNDFISKALKDFSLKDDELNRKLISKMMKIQIPINKDTINKSIKTLERFDEIINLNKNRKIVLLVTEDHKNEEILNDNMNIEFNDDILNKETLINEDIDDKTNSNIDNKANSNIVKDEEILDIDIDKFIICENIENEAIDVTESVSKYIGDIVPGRKINSSLINKVLFLLKNNMNVNIKNLTYLSNIFNGDNFLVNDIFDLVDIIKGTNLDKLKNHIFDIPKGMDCYNDYIDYIENEISFILKGLDNYKTEANKQIEKKVKVLEKKVDFIKELNDNMTFFYIPTIIRKDDVGNIVMLNKYKKSKYKTDDLKVYICLNMEYLGTVKSFLTISDHKIKIIFDVSSENKQFFKDNDHRLKDILHDCGYKNIFIDYSDDFKKDFNEFLIDDNNKHYYIDIRV